jgi:condensin complex subunit 1
MSLIAMRSYRKSTSLAPQTRKGLANALADSVNLLSKIIAENSSKDWVDAASLSFRDAFACHVYMLYSFMFLLESDSKGNSKVSDDILQMRQISSAAMVKASETMACYRSSLWQRGVPDEALVILPCRIAYLMLEHATGVMARKTACSDLALRMIAVTLDANESVLSSVTAALMDLMHSFEHMANLASELCTLVAEEPVNRLAVELIREFGRLDNLDGKSIGVKNVAPFISDLALLRPRLVFTNIAFVLPQLNAELYNLRSSIVTAISHVMEFLVNQKETIITNPVNTNEDHAQLPFVRLNSIDSLLQILTMRVHDISSYTRASTMKAWIRLTECQAIPKERIIDVTKIAIDRLQDKTVVVRKQAMQVRKYRRDWCKVIGRKRYR